MWKWLRKKLGIDVLEARMDRASKAIKRIDGQNRTAHPPQRRDEIERARARRRHPRRYADKHNCG